MKKNKLSRAFLISSLLVLSLVMAGCMPGTDGDDDGEMDDDAFRNAPVVFQLA